MAKSPAELFESNIEVPKNQIYTRVLINSAAMLVGLALCFSGLGGVAGIPIVLFSSVHCLSWIKLLKIHGYSSKFIFFITIMLLIILSILAGVLLSVIKTVMA